jgi:DNA-binding transcriptional MocR family regulator
MEPMNTAELENAFERYRAMSLRLDMQRGQPSDANFSLSNNLFTSVGPDDTVTPSGIDIRNYPGGIAGLPEARALFAEMLGTAPEEVIVGNNASLALMADVLSWALLRGLKDSRAPWVQGSPKMLVTVPGYDRHFLLLEALGFRLLSVPMTTGGPDVDAIEALVSEDAAVKGILFVPTYSNPTGDTTTAEVVERLVSMQAAAEDFTIFADDAYRVHHLSDDQDEAPDLLAAAKAAGQPDRVIVFGSTSKITLASAGLGFMAASEANIAYLGKLLSAQSIGPNKVEQYRHVKFLRAYPGGVKGLMRDHACILAPKFAAVQEVLERELGGTGLASWTNPKGGYFVSLTTTKPVASRVVSLAHELGVTLTPAGATYPGGDDPHDANIRLAPTRPPVGEVRLAMEVVALCVKLASSRDERATA